MSKEISILILEDTAADVVRIHHALRQAGLSFRSKRVDSQADFLRELQRHPPDVILSDHGLPSFDGFTVLAMARDQCPDVPFIFVSGSRGEQTALETFKKGAADYVLKHRLNRVVSSVQYALREAEVRRERLSNRKFLVLRMIASGKAVSQIAMELFLSVETISTCRAWVLDKMDMKNNAELMHYAVRKNLVN